MTFTISTKSGATLNIEADSYEKAAQKAVRKLIKSRAGHGKIFASRTTGDNGKSGWFQAYQYDRKVNGANSNGEPFHVM